jgi:hypothetical protein
MSYNPKSQEMDVERGGVRDAVTLAIPWRRKRKEYQSHGPFIIADK